jgi:hypothetical protein
MLAAANILHKNPIRQHKMLAAANILHKNHKPTFYIIFYATANILHNFLCYSQHFYAILSLTAITWVTTNNQTIK